MKKICKGRISSPFGTRIHPITKVQTFHNGIDISCPEGTPIYSPIDGIIMQVYYHDSGGKSIIMKDINSNDRYGFAHLSQQLVKTNDIVAKGDLIAKSGNTGRSTGPHLHLTYAAGGTWSKGQSSGHTFQDPTEKLVIEL